MPKDKISFRGSIFKISIDKEGETRIQFSVPLSFLESMRKASNFIEQELEITIKKVG